MTDTQESPEQHSTASPADSWLRSAEIAPGILRGQQLGPYVLVERLGGGAAAAVYRAVDQRSGVQVALKVLLPNADTVMRERFRLEGRTHSQLDHSNIVPIYDIGQTPDDTLTYLAMELVRGPDLSDVMEEFGQLSAMDAARLLAPIAEALDFAHRAGVVHRDVKPSNVLFRIVAPDAEGAVRTSVLDEPVTPLLSDFGIARALDAPELTNAGRTIGTPTYMSPEQCADSHEIDGRSDLYSLGAVFYRCVVGRPPFSGSTTQILHAHVYEAVTIPAERLEGLPPQAVELLRRALAKRPAQRYASGAEMAADLRWLATGQSTGRDGDNTATMTAVPSVRVALPNVVLVEGVEGQGVRTPGLPSDYQPQDTTGPRTLTPVSLPAEKRRPWVGILLGTAMATLVLVGGVALALNLLPAGLFGPAQATPTPALVALPPVITPAATVATGTPSTATASGAATTPNPDTLPSVAPGGTANGTPSVAANGTLSPTVVPTPTGPITGYWEDAQDAYADRDWAVTRDYLTLVRRIDPTYRQVEADQMWFDVQVGLAAQRIIAGELAEAVDSLQQATQLRPQEGQVSAIAQALAALVSPNTQDKRIARWTLGGELVAYGEALRLADEPCSAAAQFQAAESVWPASNVSEVLAETQRTCAEARQRVALGRELEMLTGRLLYSTQEGQVYRVFQAPALPNATSRLVIEDGTLPARQVRGRWLAFHSTRPSAPGIALVELSPALTPSTPPRQLTSAPEDAQDAPPSWNPSDSRIVYASSVMGDRRSRIYWLDADGQGAATSIVVGRDPAWHPTQDRIVYNGFDPTGGKPGLWLVDSDGSAPRQLTDNGNDIRPTWTPDGRSVVYMSSRNGDWDLFRVVLANNELMQLTTDPAQDGLPTVSPDGKWVAFASDRGGVWRIWITSIEGGVALPLFAVNGVLVNWLEHAVQWIP